MTEPRTRLEHLLGGEALAPLRTRLRRRFALGRMSDAIVLGRLEPHERRALEGILGLRARSASSLRLTLSELDAVLANAGLAASLRDALELLDGAIPDLAAERARHEQLWSAAFTVARSPGLVAFLANNAARGMIKRLTRNRPELASKLLEDVERVLDRLPAQGMPRSQLAAEALGDAHGLDAGRSIATVIMAVLRREEETDRETWARAGVLVNELAAPALVLNLPVAADSAFGDLVAHARTAGLPLHLTLRNLVRSPGHWLVQDRDVFVCENPNVVAIAADLLGTACAPLVCTEGMPSASQRTLLSQLAAGGARLHYHGDFDWPGIRIANYVLATFSAMSWRMHSADYAGKSGRALEGTPVAANWDPELRLVMESSGYVLEEEAVVSSLCEDLSV